MAAFQEGRDSTENKLWALRELGRKEQVLGREKASPTAWLSFVVRLQSKEDVDRVERMLTSVVFGGDLAVTL